MNRYNRGLYYWSLLTSAATFPLIFIGGLVTSKQAGLAVPDWPNSFGYNMFLFPVRLWQGNIFYEHVHRLGGSIVGMLCVVLMVWALRTDSRRHLRRLSVVVLVGVIVQGILGGLRVVYTNIYLAMVHGCVAQAFFCLTALMTLAASRRWAESSPVVDDKRITRGMVIGLIAVAVIYCQLVVAAIMRHSGAGLAAPDVPLMYGKWAPPTNADQLKAINDLRVWKMNLDQVTMAQLWLQYAHRVGAILVSAAILTASGYVIARLRHRRELFWPAVMMVVLLVIQITLGVATVLYRKPADVASAHVAVGALVLVTSFILAAQCWHLSSWGRDFGRESNIMPTLKQSTVSTAVS